MRNVKLLEIMTSTWSFGHPNNTNQNWEAGVIAGGRAGQVFLVKSSGMFFFGPRTGVCWELAALEVRHDCFAHVPCQGASYSSLISELKFKEA